MKRWLVLGLIWQLIKMYLFKQITISQVNTMMTKNNDDAIINLKMEHLKAAGFCSGARAGESAAGW